MGQQQQIQKTKTSQSSSSRRESNREIDRSSPSGKTIHKN